MASPSPILPLMEAADAAMRAWGDPPEGHSDPVLVAEQIAEMELEYAAIRKQAGLLDQPHRGVIVVTGADRLDFLGRMVTQEVKGLGPFTWRHSFWLNRKGRIDADMRVVVLPDRVLLEMDIHAVARTMAGLSAYVITEDVTLSDATHLVHRLGVHGPGATDVLGAIVSEADVMGGGGEAERPRLRALVPEQVTTVSFDGSIVTVVRDDSTGEVGLEVFVPVERARAMYEAMLALAHEHGAESPAATAPRPGKPISPLLRPIGWHAFNIARIEAGTVLYNLDFGPNNLPHECGDEVLRSRVSFKKGCYLGQEIVARMDARGKPKVVLVPIALEGSDARDGQGTPRQPVTGAPLFAPADGEPDPNGEPVGVVTSSTVSPMRSSTPVAFAMVKQAFAAPGTALFVQAEGSMAGAAVQERMAFWKREG